MKSKILIITISILFLLSFSIVGNAHAQKQKDFSLRGGVTYTTMSDDGFEDSGMDSGFGFYLGGKRKLNNSLKGIVQYERYFFSESITETDSYGNTYTYDTEMNLNAIVGLISLDLMDEQETSFALMGGPGYYFGEVSAEGVMSFDLESSIGFKLGAGMKHQIQEDLNINVNGFYRILETGLDLEEEFATEDDVELSGLEINGGLSYSF